MKDFTATYFRRNNQLTSGGYETTRTIQSGTLRSAKKKAQAIADKCLYGSMTLIDVNPKN
jgi:hypothetical protein